MESVRYWLATCALLACTRATPPDRIPDIAVTETDVGTDTAPARDSTWVVVRDPTLVAFWPANAQALIDSGGDDATALDDFGYHLASADSGLGALGIRVEDT